MSPACVRMDVDVDTLEFRGRVGTYKTRLSSGKKQKIAASCGQVQPPSRRSSSLIRAGKNGTAGAQDRITGSYRNSKVLLSSPNSDRVLPFSLLHRDTLRRKRFLRKTFFLRLFYEFSNDTTNRRVIAETLPKVFSSFFFVDPNERSGRSIEELRFAITRKDFLARADVALSKEPPSREDGDQYCNPQEQNQLEACSFEEKKNRHLGCLHPVGHFRHARRHVALLPPAVVLLATSPFLDDP
ncbi:hypothetical protein V1477_001163 [Vespula maculifrons]|uniref:Uncharacterized protein n=1 Tax=Vespula maculifrons TaxID=7453 RepID=A0ABD2CZN2_VESMC